MKKCRKCGKENPAEMRFCLECGIALSEPPAAKKLSEQVTESLERDGITVPNTGNTFGQSVPTYTKERPKSRKGIILLAVAGVVGILFLIIGIAGVLVYFSVEGPPLRPLVSTPKVTPQSPTAPDNEPLTFPPPTNPTKRGIYRTKQGTGWQLSGIVTVSSENFRVVVNGKIDIDGVEKRVSAKGVEGYEDRRIHKEFRTGALLMRTHYPDGSHSNIQAVSDNEYWQNYPNEQGKLEFIINDKAPDYNDGRFTIIVTMVNVPKNKK